MDATNAGTPAAGGQISGDVHRQAAIKRLKKMQGEGGFQRPAGSPPPATIGQPPGPRGY